MTETKIALPKKPTVKPAPIRDLYLISALVRDGSDLKHLQSLVEEAGASIKKADDLGARKLHYPIKKQTELNLISIFFTAAKAVIPKLNKELRHDEILQRYLLTSWNDDIDRAPRTNRRPPNRENR